ncbi:MAG: SctK family type III secretion system sorting platform protein [Verrucomicrobia bacterium]|nr:SctK family type III secretion system sorting platform protein [Verrucomicrobiota bacterium]
MEKSCTSWLTQVAKTQPDLYRSIYDFNLRPQFWVHPTRLASVPASACCQKLSGIARSEPIISRSLRTHFELDQIPWWDFRINYLRLALLAPERLQLLAAYCGAVMHRTMLTRLISRADRLRAKELLGPGPIEYAIRRGQLLLTGDLRAFSANEGELAQVVTAGWKLLAQILSGEAEGVRTRFHLKQDPATLVSVQTGRATAPELGWQLAWRIGQEVLNPQEIKCLA